MKKLNLDELHVVSFVTFEGLEPRGTVNGHQQFTNATCFDPGCRYWSVAATGCENTCDVSCADTACVPACQGGGNISLAQSCYANCGPKEEQ